MNLKNKYVIGCHVMWYEVEMFPEYIDSCIQMTKGIDNPANVTFDFCFNFQEYLERADNDEDGLMEISTRLQSQIDRLLGLGSICDSAKFGPYDAHNIKDDFYNIAAYRRDLNHNYCEKVDFVLWGETDSLWPKQTLQIIEAITEQEHYPKFLLNFAGRKNWDNSWDVITHPLYKNVQFQEDDAWTLENEASEKSYMTIDRMNEINSISLEDIEIQLLPRPKADGSCLVISSELIKSGVNIPHAIIHCGEDESFLRMAKTVLGNEFVQYNVKNILRVHNRRHPRKRMYIKGENNPMGFCGSKKGDWWDILEKNSKFNLDKLRKNVKFVKKEDVLKQINQ